MSSILSDGTKNSSTLKKAVVPKKYPKRRWSPDRRDRSRSPAKRPDRSHGGGGGGYSSTKRTSHGSHKRKSSDGGNSSKDSNGPRAKKAKTKKKGTSFLPTSDSFYDFLSEDAFNSVKAVGLSVDDLSNVDNLPIGGRIQLFYDNWLKINCSDWVLKVVKTGYKIPLHTIPKQRKVPTNPNAIGQAFKVLVKEADDLIDKHAVRVVEPCKGQYISSYFAVKKPRKVDEFRPILNLKYFNLNVRKYKFSMETVATVRDWVKPGYFCISLDIKDAFLHIAFDESSRKYLRFNWLDQLLEWCVIVFGLTCSPRVLTKVLKPVIAFIRVTWGILITIYMDDMLLQARSIEECTLHCHIVIIVFMSLGWSFKWAKCDLVPKQHFTHLGFDFDTVKMTISCQSVKVIKLRNFCVEIYSKGKITVHNLEKMLGFMESLRPAVPLAALHYRSLQKQLLVAKKGIRIPRKIIFLSQKSLAELKWWKSPSGFVAQCSAPIREPEPTLNIWSDANLTMGGAHCSRGTFYQRQWSQKELQLQPHINLLEIRAAREGLSLARPRDIVRINLDSRTASAYIKKQGGTRSSVLNHEACLLWKEAVSRKLTLVTPLWLSTKDNAMADFLSRHQLVQWEFLLSDDVFQLVLDNFHISPTLDVFASRDTKKLTRYMSWFPDPEAVARDALLHPWDQESYAFPPVPLILKSLQKIEREKIRVVMILPKWPSAIWWTHVQSLLLDPILPLPSYKTVLTMVDRSKNLPYLDPLVAVHLQSKI